MDIAFDRRDADGEPCTILHVARTIAYSDAAYEGEAKHASTRDVPVPVGVVLDELLLHQTRTGGSGSERVFASPKAGADWWCTHTFSPDAWLPAIARAAVLGRERGVRLPAGVTPHKLRHTAVALWVAAGATAQEVCARAGHHSVAYTLDTYGGLFPDRGRAVDRALDGLALSARESLRTVQG